MAAVRRTTRCAGVTRSPGDTPSSSGESAVWSSVTRYQPLSLRSGDVEDWKTVRWSLLDDGSGQGTFVNQTRLETGAAVSLNAEDLIGLGSSDPASSRAGGRETFVYRLKPPEAFLDLVNITETD